MNNDADVLIPMFLYQKNDKTNDVKNECVYLDWDCDCDSCDWGCDCDGGGAW